MDDVVVYLAGPISNKSYSDASAWRYDAARRLREAGMVPLDPLVKERHLANRTTMNPHGHPETVFSTPDAIFSGDTFEIMRCHILLANLSGADSISIGTMIEIGIAWAWGKKLVLVMEAENVHGHAFLDTITRSVFTTLDDAVTFITGVYGRKT